MTKSTSTFTIDRVGLTILLSTVAKFAGKATPYNLVDLVFEKGRLFANCFNGEAGIKAIVAASGGGEDTQKIIFGVNVDLLSQIVGTMTGDIKMSVQDKKVLIKSGKASSSLSAVLGASLPAIETGNMTPIASISGEALLTVLNALQFAAVDNARPVLEFDPAGIQQGERTDPRLDRRRLCRGAHGGQGCRSQGELLGPALEWQPLHHQPNFPDCQGRPDSNHGIARQSTRDIRDQGSHREEGDDRHDPYDGERLPAGRGKESPGEENRKRHRHA